SAAVFSLTCEIVFVSAAPKTPMASSSSSTRNPSLFFTSLAIGDPSRVHAQVRAIHWWRKDTCFANTNGEYGKGNVHSDCHGTRMSDCHGTRTSDCHGTRT